jgi:hypothetical protein
MSTNSPSTPRPRGIAASASTSTPIPGELHNRWHDEEYAGLKERLCRGLAEGLVSQEGAVPSRRNVA